MPVEVMRGGKMKRVNEMREEGEEDKEAQEVEYTFPITAVSRSDRERCEGEREERGEGRPATERKNNVETGLAVCQADLCRAFWKERKEEIQQGKEGREGQRQREISRESDPMGERLRGKQSEGSKTGKRQEQLSVPGIVIVFLDSDTPLSQRSTLSSYASLSCW
jgi:hypothetical protein